MTYLSVEGLGYIAAILSVILSIITVVCKIIFNKQPYQTKTLKFDLYEKILNTNNKVLSYTYLREYLGCPISDNMIEYILKSTYFYDFITVWKNIYLFIEWDSTAKKVKYKNEKPKRRYLAIAYFIFLLPFFSFFGLSKEIMNSGYLIPSIMITAAFTIIAVFYFLMELGDRVLAIKLMEKLEKNGCVEKEKSLASVAKNQKRKA